MKLFEYNNNSSYSSGYGFLTRIGIMTIATLFAAWLLPGVSVTNIWIAAVTAFVISILDNLVRPALIIITLPVNILSQGLFIFVINALIILLAGALVRGFSVDGFWNALLFSLILTIFDNLIQGPAIVAQHTTYVQKKDKNNDIDNPDHFDDYEIVE